MRRQISTSGPLSPQLDSVKPRCRLCKRGRRSSPAALPRRRYRRQSAAGNTVAQELSPPGRQSADVHALITLTGFMTSAASVDRSNYSAVVCPTSENSFSDRWELAQTSSTEVLQRQPSANVGALPAFP